MGQRARGVLTLLLALLIVLAVSALNGRDLPGTAVAQPVPAPTQVGDCVLEDLYWAQGEMDTTSTVGSVPPAQLGPCDGARYGEVFTVSTTTPADSLDCYGPVNEYLGLPSVDSGGSSGWQIGINAYGVTVSPSALQTAAGQRWAACVVVPATAVAGASSRFPAPVRDAMHSDNGVIGLLGACFDDLKIQLYRPCVDPHGVEVIGYRDSTVPRTSTQLDQECRALVTRMTGLADPTGGGRLTVEVLSFAYDNQGNQVAGTAAAADANGFTVCSVRPDDPAGRLTAGLLALNGRPIPLG